MHCYLLPDFEKDDYMAAGQSFTKRDFETFDKELRERNGNDDGDEAVDDGVSPDDDDDDLACRTNNNSSLSGFTKAEIMYMKENKVVELPHNFPRKLIVTKHKIQKITFGAFELRTTFPHNIALLKNGTIMYCTDFSSSAETRSSSSVSSPAAMIYVDGFPFSSDQVLIYLLYITSNY